jgi:tetratricopeptide (TPR) repeat protein
MKHICVFISFTITLHSIAQNNKDLAYEKATTAISLMDKGMYNESIGILKESQKLDPTNILYSYEIAYAYYCMKEYKKTIKILKPHTNHTDANDQYFQLLGNSYDYIGKPQKALLVYNYGLTKFPKSGKLYLEKGNVYWGQQQYNRALKMYESGIEADPFFPSNYYRAALLYCNSQNPVWGMIYGEIFMNLETKTKRTSEISKLLFKTYTNQISFNKDSILQVSFCKNFSISENQFEDSSKHIKIPFCSLYERTILSSLDSKKNIDIQQLHTMRQNFIKHYFESDFHSIYPVVLFDFQKMVYEAGHLEAYNYWILSLYNKEILTNWIQENQQKWNEFEMWFNQNHLPLNSENAFYSKKY